jgi:hypothetical protein
MAVMMKAASNVGKLLPDYIGTTSQKTAIIILAAVRT